MNLGVTRLVAANFGLCAFAVAIVSGLATGNTPAHVLAAALFALFICHFIGLAIGTIAERVVAEHITAYRDAHPVPEAAQSTNDSKRNRRL